jgi:hypothetical protein
MKALQGESYQQEFKKRREEKRTWQGAKSQEARRKHLRNGRIPRLPNLSIRYKREPDPADPSKGGVYHAIDDK